MDKLKELLARCKCGVLLTVNEHRNYYDTAEQFLDEATRYECPPKIDPEVAAKMIEMDNVIVLTCYPDTPIGSHEVWHYDLEAAIDQMLTILAKKPKYRLTRRMECLK